MRFFCDLTILPIFDDFTRWTVVTVFPCPCTCLRLQRTRVIGLQAGWRHDRRGRLASSPGVHRQWRAFLLDWTPSARKAGATHHTHARRPIGASDQQRMRESCNCTPERCNFAPENWPQSLPADALTSFATPDWRPFGSAAFAATCRCLTCPSPCAASHLLPLSHAMTC